MVPIRILFRKKNVLWVLSGTRVFIFLIYAIGIAYRVTQRPADKHRREWTRAKACVVAFAPPPAFFFFFAAQARKLSLSESLWWAEGAVKRQA